MRRYAADISSLAEEFQQRFRDFAAIEKEITLFSSPFSMDPDDALDHLQLELIELHCDAECRSRHQQLPLVIFYRQLDKGRLSPLKGLRPSDDTERVPEGDSWCLPFKVAQEREVRAFQRPAGEQKNERKRDVRCFEKCA
ncbi:hypothetical protein AAFF_G00236550 [Aldrovandia affinis]|uniref:Uncharacterized protein n=1 Tax=Aldrovandia affinis TaxID=143900 RepID=A0AAD7RF60_9TELE|nr:hypothetical protein AAFF_G00236550 [Aldrovandia affinis]